MGYSFWIWCLCFWLDACPCHVRLIRVNLRAAEVRSAEATELPVWKRPPVSVANGLCHPWTLDPGSCGSRKFSRIKRRRLPRIGVMGCSFWICYLFLKDWIPGQVTPPNRYALWRGPRQPGMTRFLTCWLCFGETFPPFHLSTFPLLIIRGRLFQKDWITAQNHLPVLCAFILNTVSIPNSPPGGNTYNILPQLMFSRRRKKNLTKTQPLCFFS